MFEPFEDVTDFYEGLIVWCDPSCYETDCAIPYDRRKSRELRPCLVISVNSNTRTFQAARLSATPPSDPSHWVKIDSPPPITWKLNDAWIWVGPPPTITMIFNNAKVMHLNKDVYYSTHPVSSANLQNYWTHRQAYMARQMSPRGWSLSSGPFTNLINSDEPSLGPSIRPSTKSHTYPQHSISNSNSYYAEPPIASARHSPPKYQQQPPMYPSPNYNYATTTPTTPYYPPPQSPAFHSLSAPPVVVPSGFSEVRPGLWRNPVTGELWHASSSHPGFRSLY
ncbi:hypothetical protein C8F04DRAFT_1091170 [Mycena alexandri]|uniref:Uncharacterized protein n=1 Tax=Mycena alexandri TaxID=1745969 RepID=A0AAD6X782_9AGAR|nr:hypothetical protein C8F04DRAFT_1091170 [Mycena alexandri]